MRCVTEGWRGGHHCRPEFWSKEWDHFWVRALKGQALISFFTLYKLVPSERGYLLFLFAGIWASSTLGLSSPVGSFLKFMPQILGFKPCQVLSPQWGHSSCFKESHLLSKCRVCSGFKNRSRKLRKDKLKLHLMESSLRPAGSDSLSPDHRPQPLKTLQLLQLQFHWVNTECIEASTH